MDKQQPGQSQNAKDSAEGNLSRLNKATLQPSPMDKFNDALRKILSVRKKDINKK